MAATIPTEMLDTIICPHCHSELPSGDNVCGYCGKPTVVKKPSRAAANAMRPADASHHQKPIVEPPSSNSLLDKKWFMLAFLFGAAMFLGIPFLWKSRAFSKQGKIIVSVLVTIYSIAIFWGFALVMIWCYRSIMQSIGA